MASRTWHVCAPCAISRRKLKCSCRCVVSSIWCHWLPWWSIWAAWTLGRPGITRFWHFIRSKNLPFSKEEVHQTCAQCTTCSSLKPMLYQPPRNKLIRATPAWERISIDFKGPLTTSHRGNKYLLIVVDEYSCFPFAFAYSIKDLQYRRFMIIFVILLQWCSFDSFK